MSAVGLWSTDGATGKWFPTTVLTQGNVFRRVKRSIRCKLLLDVHSTAYTRINVDRAVNKLYRNIPYTYRQLDVCCVVDIKGKQIDAVLYWDEMMPVEVPADVAGRSRWARS